MGETFMSAITQIEDLFRKKGQIVEKAASLISEAILDRIQNGTITRTTEKDIKNAVQKFSSEEQIEILTRALVLVGMNINKTSRNFEDERPDSRKKVKSRSDIFGRYDD